MLVKKMHLSILKVNNNNCEWKFVYVLTVFISIVTMRVVIVPIVPIVSIVPIVPIVAVSSLSIALVTIPLVPVVSISLVPVLVLTWDTQGRVHISFKQCKGRRFSLNFNHKMLKKKTSARVLQT